MSEEPDLDLRIAQTVRTLRSASREMEGRAYALAGDVDKALVARLITLAAELDQLAAQLAQSPAV